MNEVRKALIFMLLTVFLAVGVSGTFIGEQNEKDNLELCIMV